MSTRSNRPESRSQRPFSRPDRHDSLTPHSKRRPQDGHRSGSDDRLPSKEEEDRDLEDDELIEDESDGPSPPPKVAEPPRAKEPVVEDVPEVELALPEAPEEEQAPPRRRRFGFRRRKDDDHRPAAKTVRPDASRSDEELDEEEESADEETCEQRPAVASKKRVKPARLRPKLKLNVRSIDFRSIRFSWKWGVGALAAVLVFIWLLPMIVGHTSLVNHYVGEAVKDLKGSVEVRSASLGWFSPIVLHGVAVHDENGQPLAEIATVRSERSLLSLLRNTKSPGPFHVQEPKFHVVLRDNGSNLEDALENYLTGEPKERIDVAVDVADGSVTLAEARGSRTWQIDKFQFAVEVPANPAKPLIVAASGVVPDKQQKGQFNVALQLVQEQPARKGGKRAETADEEEQPGPDRVKMKIESLPLEMIQPLVRRFVAGAKLSGRLSASLDGRWDSDRADGSVVLEGSVRGDSLKVSCKALGQDQPSLERLQAEGHVVVSNGRMRIDNAKVQSELGSLNVTGTFDFGKMSATDRLASLVRQSYKIDGKLNLAKLATLLPGTLRIRKETQITAGELQVELASQRGQDGMSWQGQIKTSNLTAQQSGKTLTWKQPVTVVLSAKETAQGLTVDRFDCKSEFLSIHAAGDREKFDATMNFDLRQLADQSGGFIDLAGLQLAGVGSSNLRWKRTSPQSFEANLGFQADNFQLSLPGRFAWAEDRVAANLIATGMTDLQTARLDTARLQIDTGTVQTPAEQLVVRLMERVSEFRTDRSWPVEVTCKGQLARWVPRLSPWIKLDGWNLSGSYDLVSKAVVSQEAIAVQDFDATLSNLLVAGPTLNLSDSRVQAKLAGQYRLANRRLDLDTANVTGAGFNLAATRVMLRLPGNDPMQLAGKIEGRIGLDRLQQWTSVGKPDPSQWQVRGTLSGDAQFEQTAGVIATQFNAVIGDLQAMRPTVQPYQEREIRLTGQARYNDLNRWLQIERLRLTSGTVNADATGKLALVNGQTEVQLNGSVDYDLDRLSQLLQTRYGDGFWISGRGSAPISYTGPLGSNKATAKASLRWDRANFYGFQAGAAELQAACSQGVVAVQPLKLAVNEGQLNFGPRVQLSPEPTLTHDPGRFADKVRITPEMCNAMFKYLSPIVAGVTQADGQFSIDLESCRVPLADPSKGEIWGRYTVHSVRIGPGALLQEISQLLGALPTAQLKKESVVRFCLKDGRVYHDQMSLEFGNVTLRTMGSVGLDQSLLIDVEMPMPASWQANPALAPALRNQAIKVRVGGSLHQPRIDRAALDQEMRKLLQNAVVKGIETPVNQEINNLFNRLKQQPAAKTAPKAAPKAAVPR